MRRFARWARLVLGGLVLVGVLVQFVSAGYGFFVGGFDFHEDLGWAIHLLPVLLMIAGLIVWRPRGDLILSIAIGVVGFLQPILVQIGDWAAVFHPLNALVLFFLTHVLFRRDLVAVRARALPSAGAVDLPR